MELEFACELAAASRLNLIGGIDRNDRFTIHFSVTTEGFALKARLPMLITLILRGYSA